MQEVPNTRRPSGWRAHKWRIAALLLLVLVLAWVGWQLWGQPPIGKGPAKSEARWSAWLAEWHWSQGLADLELAAPGLESLQMFAVYFDQQDRLLLTDRWQEALPPVKAVLARQGVPSLDLSIVNDRVLEAGGNVQKDPDLVARLVADASSRERHITEIVEIALTYGFTGVEIDYEAVHRKDWERVALLYEALYEQLRQHGMTLRVVLEPRAPLETIDWPAGPTYVVMAYNLHGFHNGPGPKADQDLIRTVAGRLRHLPDSGLALATGGFAWADDGSVTALTELDAAKWAEQAGQVPQRDAKSGSLVFHALDEQGRDAEIWYADEQTLRTWRNWALALGVDRISLWRLGELSEASATLPAM